MDNSIEMVAGLTPGTPTKAGAGHVDEPSTVPRRIGSPCDTDAVGEASISLQLLCDTAVAGKPCEPPASNAPTFFKVQGGKLKLNYNAMKMLSSKGKRPAECSVALGDNDDSCLPPTKCRKVIKLPQYRFVFGDNGESNLKRFAPTLTNCVEVAPKVEVMTVPLGACPGDRLCIYDEEDEKKLSGDFLIGLDCYEGTKLDHLNPCSSKYKIIALDGDGPAVGGNNVYQHAVRLAAHKSKCKDSKCNVLGCAKGFAIFNEVSNSDIEKYTRLQKESTRNAVLRALSPGQH